MGSRNSVYEELLAFMNVCEDTAVKSSLDGYLLALVL